jgi:hypothetical protein
VSRTGTSFTVGFQPLVFLATHKKLKIIVELRCGLEKGFGLIKILSLHIILLSFRFYVFSLFFLVTTCKNIVLFLVRDPVLLEREYLLGEVHYAA